MQLLHSEVKEGQFGVFVKQKMTNLRMADTKYSDRVTRKQDATMQKK